MSQNDSFLKSKMSRRQVLQLGAAAGAGAFLAACGTPAAPAPKAEELLKSANTIPMDTLIAEAKKEGNLTTIALPHDWANYGELLDTFKKKYGIKINELNPDAGSSDQDSLPRRPSPPVRCQLTSPLVTSMNTSSSVGSFSAKLRMPTP